MLNAQPMGFYSVGTLIEDARRHGVKVLPIDLAKSAWDHSLELHDGRMVVPSGGVVRVETRKAPSAKQQPPAVRLGLRLVRGLGSVAREKLEKALADGPFADIADFVRRSGVDQGAVRALCEAGAFDSMVADQPPDQRRRVALWRALDAMRGAAGPLAPRPTPDSLIVNRQSSIVNRHFPAMTRVETTDADYRMTGLSLNGHPMRHLRKLLSPNAIRTADDLMRNGRDGERVAHAGLVIVRQRPGTAKGFVFLSLEDETGILNVVVTPKRFERQALLISNSPLLLIRGTLQVEHGVVNLRGESFRALKADAGETWAKSHDFH
jgi:error-prone DNA polymerase